MTRYIESEIFRDYPIDYPNANVKTHIAQLNVDSDKLKGVQSLGVVEATPKGYTEGDGTVIVPNAWTDYSDRLFNRLRLAHIATSLNKRAIAVDNPGVGNISNGITERQTELLRKGQFNRELGRTAWEAIQKKVGLNPGEDLDMYLYSLGNLTGIGMLQEKPEGVQISSVNMGETTFRGSRSKGRYMRDYLQNAPVDFDKYQAMNPEWAYNPENASQFYLRVLGQLAANRFPIHGVLNSDATSMILDAANLDQNAELRDTSWRLWNGGNSLVSPTASNEHAAEQLRTAGFKDVRRFTAEGEYHNLNESFPVIAEQLKEVA